MEATDKANEWRRVRVCFGKAVIADHVKDDPAWCARYAEAMKNRFPCCTVTNEPLSGVMALP